jgi:L-rhamnose mutarotase
VDPLTLPGDHRAGCDATAATRGLDLFHLVECEHDRGTLAQLEHLPVNVAWQARMAELLEVVHDHSGEADAELPVMWQL